ncbi:hypothetical protein [Actinomadura fibrosa]|uniref:Uncharacterized protein n=1 Tax=Actinomadura fibrosa TaxID=111802 RepID=A0ABW2XNL4_9ACTN|nr:hypothetical protein [Actinomadura fibrosa]
MMFRFHDAEDRDRASDGVSRYGVYLRRHPRLFTDFEDPVTVDPVLFVIGAWQVATAPIMSPPYLDWTAERLLSVELSGSEHDGSLIARCQFAADRPAALREVGGFADWQCDAGWSGVRGYQAPDDDVLARGPVMLTSTAVLWSIPADRLYAPADAPETLTTIDAKQAVRRLAELLDARLAPVLAALDTSPGRGAW